MKDEIEMDEEVCLVRDEKLEGHEEVASNSQWTLISASDSLKQVYPKVT